MVHDNSSLSSRWCALARTVLLRCEHYDINLFNQSSCLNVVIKISALTFFGLLRFDRLINSTLCTWTWTEKSAMKASSLRCLITFIIEITQNFREHFVSASLLFTYLPFSMTFWLFILRWQRATRSSFFLMTAKWPSSRTQAHESCVEQWNDEALLCASRVKTGCSAKTALYWRVEHKIHRANNTFSKWRHNYPS